MNQNIQPNHDTLSTSAPHSFIKWFADITIDDIPLVGGKNASLGEMVRELTSKGVMVPDGFAITAEAYRYFIREAGLDEFIRTTLADLDTHDMKNLSQRGHTVRQAILNATLPQDLQELAGPIGSCRVTALFRWMWLCVRRPLRKTCPMPALPGSRKLISTYRV